jgi:hypothetical protein
MKEAVFEQQNGKERRMMQQAAENQIAGRQRRSKCPTAYRVTYLPFPCPFPYPIVPIIDLLGKDHPFPRQLQYSGDRGMRDGWCVADLLGRNG